MPFWLTKLLVRTRLAGFSPRARRLADGGTSFLRYYSDRVLAAPIEELLDPAIVPDSLAPHIINLNLPAVRAETSLSLGRSTYDRAFSASPKGLLELREAIASRYQRRDGRGMNPESEIQITHGATGAYFATLEALVNPGDRIVLFDPSSPLFSVGAKSRRAKIRWVTTWMEEGRCRFLNTAFEKAMRGAKLLVLSQPANPMGGFFSPEDLEYIAWIAAAYDVLIYADESFSQFYYGERPESFRTIAGADRRVLGAGSVTQEFGLGALRVGWLAGPRHLVRACGLMANLNAPGVPEPCQQAALHALAEHEHLPGRPLERLSSRRDYALDRLRVMGLEACCPAGGLFLWIPVAGLGMNGRSFATRLFREEQVQVGPGCAFGPGASGHIRISFAGDDGRLREGLARLARFIEVTKNSKLPDKPEPVEESVAEKPESRERMKPAFSRV